MNDTQIILTQIGCEEALLYGDGSVLGSYPTDDCYFTVIVTKTDGTIQIKKIGGTAAKTVLDILLKNS